MAAKLWIRGILSNLCGLAILYSIAHFFSVHNYVQVALGIQWLVFVLHGLPQRSEKFYDLSGSFTHLAVVATSLFAERRARRPALPQSLSTPRIPATHSALQSTPALRGDRCCGVDDATRHVSLQPDLKGRQRRAIRCDQSGLAVIHGRMDYTGAPSVRPMQARCFSACSQLSGDPAREGNAESA